MWRHVNRIDENGSSKERKNKIWDKYTSEIFIKGLTYCWIWGTGGVDGKMAKTICKGIMVKWYNFFIAENLHIQPTD